MKVTSDSARGGIAGCTTVAATFLFRTGLRLLKGGRTMFVPNGYRSPIVYLRSFAADAHDPVVRPSHGILRTVFNPTNETQFALASRGLAPFIAIGRPGEKLEPLGADRIYLPSSADWKAEAADIMRQAQLIIIRATVIQGDDSGLLWEIDHVVENIAPEKLLIFLPYLERQSGKERNARYQKFAQTVSQLFPRGLLKGIEKELFITFASDWAPRGIVRGPLPVDMHTDDARRKFLDKLFGIYQDKPFSVSRALLLFLLIILAVVTIFLILTMII